MYPHEESLRRGLAPKFRNLRLRIEQENSHLVIFDSPLWGYQILYPPSKARQGMTISAVLSPLAELKHNDREGKALDKPSGTFTSTLPALYSTHLRNLLCYSKRVTRTDVGAAF
jgi:hypothetical protein